MDECVVLGLGAEGDFREVRNAPAEESAARAPQRQAVRAGRRVSAAPPRELPVRTAPRPCCGRAETLLAQPGTRWRTWSHASAGGAAHGAAV
eukprot:7379542-Prymnesium_polylepis.1